MLYSFDKHCYEATRFVKNLAIRLGTPGNPEHAIRVLKSVFGVLRRRIVPDESLHFVSKLPLVLKGIYVDGWSIFEPLSEADTLDEFLFEIRSSSQGRAYMDFAKDDLAKNKIVTVFNALKQFLHKGELNDLVLNLCREASELA